jgi:L-alanine-DL-glutamate epimerase-like enolase superfamily enzyme
MNRRTFFNLAGMAASPLLAQTVEQNRRGMGPLKITKVEALVIRTPGGDVAPETLAGMPPLGATTGGVGLWNRLDQASPSRTKGQHTQALLVRIGTNQGLTGWGECHAPEAPRVHKTIVTDLLAPVLLGENALEVEPLWEKLYSTERLRGYSTGFYTEAIAGVDLALWDLLGQFTGMPVYRLLGGKFRDRIPTYTGIGGASVADLKNAALKAIDDGFTVVKISFSKGAGTNDIARVAAVSDAMKNKGQVLVDSLGAFKLYEAVKLGRELDRLGNVGWWEDALMPDDLSSYPKLADALDTAVCAGEELCNRFQFSDFLSAKSADIINPDVCRAGGITEVKRIATLADAHGVMWAPHISTGTALYIAASMHLAASTPNLLISEGGRALLGPLGNDLLEEPLDWKPGWIGVPERAGLGVRFNANALAKVTAA